MRKTKIVATVGPSTNNYKSLKSLIQSGANVLRINFSHGKVEEYQAFFDLIKQVRTELKVPVAIMVDTRGPEVRVKTFDGGSGILKKGGKFTLYGYSKEGDNDGVSVTEPKALENLKKGTIILANDGLIRLMVTENKKFEVVCKVLSSGLLSSNKSLSFKNTQLNLPYISAKDKTDLVWALQNGCDIISASFVNTKDDIVELKRLMQRENKECKIIAKIENSIGVKNIEGILDAADGIMVARGDLGVDIPQAKLPRIQMDLINRAVVKGKPVIVATEMLESMIKNPRPTRAEITDVANAVYNGASAVMLSAETAVGAYPDKAVRIMSEICIETEKNIRYDRCFFGTHFNNYDLTDVLSHGAVSCALKLDAKAIVLYTDTGKTASMISRYKPLSPVIAITKNEHTYNYLSLAWNCVPVYSTIDNVDIFDLACEIAKEHGIAKANDLIIVTTGTTDPINNVIKGCIV